MLDAALFTCSILRVFNALKSILITDVTDPLGVTHHQSPSKYAAFLFQPVGNLLLLPFNAPGHPVLLSHLQLSLLEHNSALHPSLPNFFHFYTVLSLTPLLEGDHR